IFNESDKTITVLPGTPIGEYEMEYTICEKANPSNCDTTTVVVKVTKTELSIPEGFSPNGDGINDGWVIKGLMYNYPNFKIRIYNRWGNLVYDYSNNGKEGKDWYWDGYSNGRWNIGGNHKVPVGTYFYIIDFNDGSTKSKQGWVYVNY
nr:gliding motility-associated C-terminal domain-containing protein [Flavobacteriaceae bacterium]